MSTLYFCIGIASGLLFHDLSGIVPGGVIVPGYIALYADQPLRILATISSALLTLFSGRLLLRWIVAYGRRRFGLFLLLGAGVKVLLDLLLFGAAALPPALQSIGIVIPGLVANEMERQGIGWTLLGLAVVSAFLYLVTLLLPRGLFP